MEFIRIDENTVRCIVNEEDMREYDVEIDDFLKNKGKVQEFLHTIVERASDEVGYEPKDGLLAMQIMMLPKNRLAITFSEKVEEGVELGELIQQVAGATMENASAIKDMFEEIAGAENNDDYKTEEKVKTDKPQKAKKQVFATMRVFEFNCLNDFEQFVDVISDKLSVKSSLYKDEQKNRFYAIFEKGRLSKPNFNYVCRMATEYGKYVSDREDKKAYIQEHLNTIIKEKAVKIIKKINKADS